MQGRVVLIALLTAVFVAGSLRAQPGQPPPLPPGPTATPASGAPDAAKSPVSPPTGVMNGTGTGSTTVPGPPPTDPWGALMHSLIGNVDPTVVVTPLAWLLFLQAKGLPDLIAKQFPDSANAWRELRLNWAQNTRDRNTARQGEAQMREILEAFVRQTPAETRLGRMLRAIRNAVMPWRRPSPAAAGPVEELANRSRAYDERVRQLDLLLQELRNTEPFKSDPRAVETIEQAGKDWLQRGDFSAVQRLVDARQAEWRTTMDRLATELLALNTVRTMTTARQQAETAVQAWRDRGDAGPLREFARAHAGRLGGNGPASRRWLEQFQQTAPLVDWLHRLALWRTLERDGLRALRSQGNEILNAINERLGPTERLPTIREVSDTDPPGRIGFSNGAEAPGAQTMLDTERICRIALGLYAGKSAALHGKAGVSGLFSQGYTAMRPYASVGVTGTVGYLLYANIAESYRRHGKSPEAAKADMQKQALVENQQAVNAEVSLEGQIAKHRDKLEPFTNVVTQLLQKNRDAIEKQVKEYREKNPGTPIDWTKKQELFEKNLAFHILQALPYAARTRIGNDVNYGHLMKFLSLPSADPKVATAHRRFLMTLYSRTLENVFPELEGVRLEGNGSEDLVTITAGNVLSKGDGNIRDALVTATLPRMATGLRLEVPPNVTPHSGVPELGPNPPPQGAAPKAADPGQGKAAAAPVPADQPIMSSMLTPPRPSLDQRASTDGPAQPR